MGQVQQLNVLYPRKYTHNGEEKTHWLKVGVAWVGEKGIDVKLWSIPVSADEDGNLRLMLRPPLPEEGRQQQQGQQRGQQQRPPQYGGAAAAQRPAYVEDGDDVPF